MVSAFEGASGICTGFIRLQSLARNWSDFFKQSNYPVLVSCSNVYSVYVYLVQLDFFLNCFDARKSIYWNEPSTARQSSTGGKDSTYKILEHGN